MFIPIVLSLLLSYALEPLVAALGRTSRSRVARPVTAAVVVSALTIGLGDTGYALSDEAAAIVAELPEAAQRLRQALQREAREAGASQQVQQAADELQRAAKEAAARVRAAACRASGSINPCSTFAST